jgi:hypothetical protein
MYIRPKLRSNVPPLFPDNFDSRQQTHRKKAPLMSNDVTHPNVPAAALFLFRIGLSGVQGVKEERDAGCLLRLEGTDSF